MRAVNRQRSDRKGSITGGGLACAVILATAGGGLIACGGGAGLQADVSDDSTGGTDSAAVAAIPAEAEAMVDIEVAAERAARSLRQADATLARVMLAINVADEQALVEQGLSLYLRSGCVRCHSSDGTPGIGPSLRGIWAEPRDGGDGVSPLVHAGYVRSALVDPSGYLVPGYERVMPAYDEAFDPRQIVAITAFIRSLDEPEPPTLDMSLARSGPTPAGGERLDPLEIFNEPTADERDRAQFERVPEAPERPVDAGVRGDGRPAWWFDGLRREGGRITLCVEALGPDLAAARRAAVDLAYMRLSERLELDSPSELSNPRLELTTVTPVPNPGGQRRYVGYVLISADP